MVFFVFIVFIAQEMNPELSLFDRDACGDELYNTTATSMYVHILKV